MTLLEPFINKEILFNPSYLYKESFIKLFALILSFFITTTVNAKTINYTNSQWANSCLDEAPTLQLDHPLDFLQNDLSVSTGYVGSGVGFTFNILIPSGSAKVYANISEPVTPFSSPTVTIAPKSPQGRMSSSVLLDVTYSEAIISCDTIFACYPMGNKIRAPLSVSDIIANSLQEISITVNGNPFQFPLNKYILKRVAKTNDSFSYINILTEYNSEVYFKGITSDNLSKLFKINSQGLVTQVSNLNPNQSDNPESAIVFNNELYFTARDVSNNGGDASFFKLNSSGSITKILSKIVHNLIVYNNHLYFTYQPTVNFGPLLHKLSTSNELKQVVQINLEQGSQDNVSYLTIYNNSLFFSARIGINSKLFKINENDDIRQVSDLSPGSYDEPSNLMVFNNELYFMAAQNDLTKLFKLNSAGIISQVTNTNPGEQDFSDPKIVFNNELYFVSYDANYLDRLYKINAQGGITQVAVINQEFGDSPVSFIQFQNELYFKATIGDDNYRLYKMDANGNIVQFDDKEAISTSFIVAHGGLYLTNNLDGFLDLYKLTK